MLAPVLFFVVASLVIGGYALLSLRTDGWRRWAGPGLLGVVMMSTALMATQLLGKPVPEWALLGDVNGRIVSVLLKEDEAIYIWVVEPGAEYPIAIALPWKVSEAKKINELEQKDVDMIYNNRNYEGVHEADEVKLPTKEVE